jgi:hypothetical protein
LCKFGNLQQETMSMRIASGSIFVLLSAALIAGCAQREELLPKSAAVPAGVDLSGNWKLVDESGDDIRRARRRDDLIHVFLESGARLKITQTREGLFISFDRAIVEEYRFGEQRVINVGPVEADRVSGWEGRAYVIETLGPENNKLVETYSLGEAGRMLQRRVDLYRGGALSSSRTQRYEKT